MNVLHALKLRLNPADPESVVAYRSVVPSTIHVSVKNDKGTLIATVDSIEGEDVKGLLITEAKDMRSLVNKVNDLIYTYVNMPENIRPHYGNLLNPEGNKQNSKELTFVKA